MTLSVGRVAFGSGLVLGDEVRSAGEALGLGLGGVGIALGLALELGLGLSGEG